MKSSVSLSIFPAKKGMPVLYSLATEENLKQIKDFGYDGVDLFVDDPHSEATKEAMKLLSKYELGVGVIMPAALAGMGLFLSHQDKKIRDEAIARIKEVIALASTVSAMVSLGLVRGNVLPDEPYEDFEKRFENSCKELLDFATPLGVYLVIEPINRYEVNTMNSVKESVDFIKKVNLPLYLMLDTFHMNIEDVDVVKTLMEALPLTKHIHFLDSNRLAPSMGHMQMEVIYRALEHAGYDGYLCLEALPKPDTYTCAKKGSEFFAKMRG